MGSVSEAEILSATLSLENAVSLLSGCDFWHTREHASQGIGALRFSDGPNGVRGENWVNGPPSLAIPCATALGASFDTGLVFELSKLLATECNRKGVHALLAPTMNIHRYPLCKSGRECYLETMQANVQKAAETSNHLAKIQSFRGVLQPLLSKVFNPKA